MKPKLSSTISVVKISDSILEFFKTCTREQVYIKVQNDQILEIASHLDGSKTIEELSELYNIKPSDFEKLMDFLMKKGILDNADPKEDFSEYEKYRRVIHFLSEHSTSHNNLVEMWDNITNATVLIVGLGAVGSWVACNLAESGVKNFILMDADVVDITNLHRQFSYTEDDLGKYKTDVLETRLQAYDKNIKVVKLNCFIDENSLNQLNEYHIDLMINCADKPNVDTTSLWIGEYGMKRDIPHIIGGGYNLHLSLIGQTIIPGKCACVMCFQKQLEEENKIDSSKVKKLMVQNRKVGSFAPMCSMIASMIGMEAIKVLSKNIIPANINRRGEFDIYSMDIQYKKYERRDDCEWCGKTGKYYHM
jgi:UBA/THIF-type NAD/FAD binding protein